MSKYTDIQQRILQLEGGKFQVLCNLMLSKMGYSDIHAFGSQAGTYKTTPGTPDTYFALANGKYCLVAYTTQQTNAYEKILEDVSACLDEKKTGLKHSDIHEIIHCHTTSRISAGEDHTLRQICTQHGISLQLFGIDRIAKDIFYHHKDIARDFLSISIDTEQIMRLDVFISRYNAQALAAPLDTPLIQRNEELCQILEALEKKDVVLLAGHAGVGKTRLALECARAFSAVHGHEIYCIRNNALPIYEDLTIYLSQQGSYLLLVDDANEISGIQHIIDFANKRSSEYDVRILMTVRDYAVEYVTHQIQEKVNFAPIRIRELGSEAIRDLMKSSYGINNPVYLDRIVNLAQGNARIAMLAGKLASEQNELDAIADASDLHAKYYGRFLKDSNLHGNRVLCCVAAIIGFLGVVQLDRLESLESILAAMNVCERDFIRYAEELHELELIDIHYNKVAKPGEQCLSNYLVKYVFIDKKWLSISRIVACSFGDNATRVVRAIGMLFSVYASEDVQDYIQEQICTVWQEFEQQQVPFLLNFIKDFAQLNTVHALNLVRRAIDAIPQMACNLEEITFDPNNYPSDDTDVILQILGRFENSKELSTVIDMLLRFLDKRPDRVSAVYQCFVRDYEIHEQSYRYDYYTQQKVIARIEAKVASGLNPVQEILAIHVCKYLLGLYFSPTKIDGRTFITSSFAIELSDGVRWYRDRCWELLISIGENTKYHDDIRKFFSNYSRGWRLDRVETDVIRVDLPFLQRLIQVVLKPSSLLDCQAVERIADSLADFEIGMPTADVYQHQEQFELLNLLKGPRLSRDLSYQERDKIRKSRIQLYLCAPDADTVSAILAVFANYQHEIGFDGNMYPLDTGMEIVLTCLADHPDLLIQVLAELTDKDIRTKPFIMTQLLSALFRFMASETLWTRLSESQCAQRELWLVSFFITLPQNLINSEYADRLRTFIIDDMKDGSVLFRGFSFLDHFSHVQPDIYICICRALLKRIEDGEIRLAECFTSLFCEPSEQIIGRFDGQYPVLASIYLVVEQHTQYIDDQGTMLQAIHAAYPSILERYIEYLMSLKMKRKGDYYERIEWIWALDDYHEILWNTVEHGFDVDNHWDVPDFVGAIFDQIANDDPHFERKNSILKQYIAAHHQDIHKMQLLFTLVSKLPEDRRKMLISYFIQKNPAYSAFENIDVEPNSYGGVGSLIPVYREKVEFLNSLLPLFEGEQFFDHKKRIMDRIEVWERQILRQQWEEIMYD